VAVKLTPVQDLDATWFEEEHEAWKMELPYTNILLQANDIEQQQERQWQECDEALKAVIIIVCQGQSVRTAP